MSVDKRESNLQRSFPNANQKQIRRVLSILETNCLLDIRTGCALWKGCKNACGYGTLSVYDRSLKKAKSMLAHRVAYMAVHGPIPPNKPCILHSCHEPCCINTEHLRAGTQKENSKDMMAAGRGVQPRGENHGRAKYNISIVRKIRSEYDQGTLCRVIGERLGISTEVVRRIGKRHRWRHVTETA